MGATTGLTEPDDRPRGGRALVVIAGEDTYHDLAAAGPMLQRLAIDAGFATRLGIGLQRFLEPGPETMSADVLVLYSYGASFPTAEQEALAALVRGGVGLVAIHCANVLGGIGDDLDPADRPLFELLGSRFVRHPPTVSARHRIGIAGGHPVTDGLPDFELHDEYYELELADDDIAVLAHRQRVDGELDASPQVAVMYTRRVGDGRVVYLALGHDARAWSEPAFQVLVRRAIAWAARRSQG